MKVRLENVDHTYVKVITSPDIEAELESKFEYRVPGYFHMPLYKQGIWDGKIRHFSRRDKTIYRGLASEIEHHCRKNGYQFTFDYGFEIIDPSHTCKIRPEFVLHAHQRSAIEHCIKTTRCVVEAATGSGKSLIAYALADYYEHRTPGKFLLIVPTLDLISQMFEDFCTYSPTDIREEIYLLHGEQKDKLGSQRIVISTWQSIFKRPKSWFDQFDVMIGDEAHEWKSDAIKKIANAAGGIKYRFGLTASPKIVPLHKATTEGIFGPLFVAIQAPEAIEKGILAPLNKIRIIELQHPNFTQPLPYLEEIEYLIQSQSRNAFIVDMVSKLPGVSLVLFHREEHGKALFNAIQNEQKFFFNGSVKREDRKVQRNAIKELDKAVIVASRGVFSRGIDIKHIEHIILASPTKDRENIIQSIGRGLRKDARKSGLNLYDIADRSNLRKQNVTYRHMKERIKVYEEFGYAYKLYKISLES